MEDETKIKVLPNPDDNVQGAAALITNETRSPERIILDTDVTDQDCLIQQATFFSKATILHKYTYTNYYKHSAIGAGLSTY